MFFLEFYVTQVLVGLRKQFINNFVCKCRLVGPTWACAAGFYNNNDCEIDIKSIGCWSPPRLTSQKHVPITVVGTPYLVSYILSRSNKLSIDLPSQSRYVQAAILNSFTIINQCDSYTIPSN